MKKFVFILSIILVFIDQLIKNVIIRTININESIILIPKFLNITYVTNDGGAFSILSGGRWYFIIISIIALIFLIRIILLDTKISRFDMFSYSLVLGGIVGNLIDRIIYGKVIDYIHFIIFNHSFAIFNFADMCIVIGAFMIIYILIVKGDSDENIYSRKRS